MASNHLRIYLNDHLAGASAGEALAERCLSNNQGTPLGHYLIRFLEEVRQDRGAILELMRRLQFPCNRGKIIAGWAAEKVGRLKLNGQLRGYSDLSRLLELEGLCLGVEGKLSGWRSLHKALPDSALEGIDLETLINRATGQRQELERHRLEAASRALGRDHS
jgi:hypothetical protein